MKNTPLFMIEEEPSILPPVSNLETKLNSLLEVTYRSEEEYSEYLKYYKAQIDGTNEAEY